MTTTLTFARLHERGAALARWIAEGGDVDRLARLDRQVRHGRRSDYAGRGPGPEGRTADGPRTLTERGAGRAAMGPICELCGRKCFAPLPGPTPEALRARFGAVALLRTCAKGQARQREVYGTCYGEAAAAVQAGRLLAQVWPGPDEPSGAG